MIPLPFPKIYLYAGLAVACIGVFLYIRFLQARVDHWRGQYDQVQATLTTERAQHQAAMDAAEAKRVRDLEEATRLRNDAAQHLQERLHANAGIADALRVRLAAERSLRTLAPASAAPANCGDYESDPTRLSTAHRELLIGEAAAAEGNVSLLEACRADYETVKVACGIR